MGSSEGMRRVNEEVADGLRCAVCERLFDLRSGEIGVAVPGRGERMHADAPEGSIGEGQQDHVVVVHRAQSTGVAFPTACCGLSFEQLLARNPHVEKLTWNDKRVTCGRADLMCRHYAKDSDE